MWEHLRVFLAPTKDSASNTSASSQDGTMCLLSEKSHPTPQDKQTNKQNLNSFQNTEQPATQTVNPEQVKSHVVLTAQAPAYEHREHSRHLELRSWSWKMEELKWKEFAEQSARGGGGALPDREREAQWVLSRLPTTAWMITPSWEPWKETVVGHHMGLEMVLVAMRKTRKPCNSWGTGKQTQ